MLLPKTDSIHVSTSPASPFSPLDKAEVLIEALPYIQRFSGKIFVIKYGGSLLEDEGLRDMMLQDLAMLKHVGVQPVLVHGGGPAMTAMLEQLQKETRFVQGHRITDLETL